MAITVRMFAVVFASALLSLCCIVPTVYPLQCGFLSSEQVTTTTDGDEVIGFRDPNAVGTGAIPFGNYYVGYYDSAAVVTSLTSGTNTYTLTSDCTFVTVSSYSGPGYGEATACNANAGQCPAVPRAVKDIQRSTGITATDVIYYIPKGTTPPANTFIIPVLSTDGCNCADTDNSGCFSYMNSGSLNDQDVSTSTVDVCAYTTFVSSGSSGDPQLVGLRGQSFQVHGIDGAVYNFISAQTIQVNSRFVFLSEGKCPPQKAETQSQAHRNCYSHPGSYCGEFGLQFRRDNVSAVIMSVIIVSGAANSGFQSVIVNNKSIAVGATISLSDHDYFVNITYPDTHFVTISSPLFNFEFDNSDFFINQRLKANIPLDKLNTHGLLGQTSTGKIYAGNSIKYIEGDVDEYMIAENSLLGNNFVFNQW